jgi:hypothetical protein
MKRLVTPVFIACLALSINFPSANAAAKQGALCNKVGQVSTASGIKYTCTKSGSKLVWNKRAKATAAAPVTPVVKDFEAWSTNIDSRTLSDQAQRNFLSWVKTRANAPKNHTQLIQENPHLNRISIMKKADDLSAQLFSSYFPQESKTIIGATQSWTDEQIALSGWNRKCDGTSMPGVRYCLVFNRLQGYVVTADTIYDARNPGNDGGALVAHEYFHLVQANLANSTTGLQTKSGDLSLINAIPVWFLEGGAEFVGYSVGALAQGASYWDGRFRMLSYGPREEFANRNAITDYEIRICCGNSTPTYPYNIGHVAIEYIVASLGFQKMLDIWVDYSSTRNFETSFEKVTGISKEAFYQKFEQIREKVELPSVTWRLDGLVNKKIS